LTGSGGGLESECDSQSSAVVRLDPRIYSREAILRTCYWYSNAAYIQAPESPHGSIVLTIQLKSRAPTLERPKPISIEEFVAEFCNSLLDFELRRQVEFETGAIRQLILAKAFSESGILEDNPPGNIDDPVEQQKPSGLVHIMNIANDGDDPK
jgi:His-Xaa-Ser system protein HxsD